MSEDPVERMQDAQDESILEYKEKLLEAVASRRHRILPTALRIFKKL
jgi:hypothetical protein